MARATQTKDPSKPSLNMATSFCALAGAVKLCWQAPVDGSNWCRAGWSESQLRADCPPRRNLQAPTVVTKTIALMKQAAAADTTGLAQLAARNQFYGATVKDMVAMRPQTRRMLLASTLKGVSAGWTTALRRQYLKLIDVAMTRKVARWGPI